MPRASAARRDRAAISSRRRTATGRCRRRPRASGGNRRRSTGPSDWGRSRDCSVKRPGRRRSPARWPSYVAPTPESERARDAGAAAVPVDGAESRGRARRASTPSAPGVLGQRVRGKSSAQTQVQPGACRRDRRTEPDSLASSRPSVASRSTGARPGEDPAVDDGGARELRPCGGRLASGDVEAGGA